MVLGMATNFHPLVKEILNLMYLWLPLRAYVLRKTPGHYRPCAFGKEIVAFMSKYLLRWIIVGFIRHLLLNRLPVSSMDRALDCCVGGRGFEPRLDQHSRSK